MMINDLLKDWKDRWKYVNHSTESIGRNNPTHRQALVNQVCDWNNREVI
jgi:hypothetical protein